MALQHNEMTKKLTKEKEEHVEDEDIQEVARLLQVHKKYTKEIKETCELLTHLLIEHGVPSWHNDNKWIIGWEMWIGISEQCRNKPWVCHRMMT